MIKAIFNDPRLYGHALTSFPGKTWAAWTEGHTFFYPKPDNATVKRTWLIFEQYIVTSQTKAENGTPAIRGYQVWINTLPVKYLEIATRYLIGSIIAVASAPFLYPVGMTIKLGHYLISPPAQNINA